MIFTSLTNFLTGKPLVVPPRSLVLLTPAGSIVKSQSGRPVPVPRGSRITPVQHDVVLDSEGNPVLETNGHPLQVTPGNASNVNCEMYKLRGVNYCLEEKLTFLFQMAKILLLKSFQGAKIN